MTDHATERLANRVHSEHKRIALEMARIAEQGNYRADTALVVNVGRFNLVAVVRQGKLVTFMYSQHNQINRQHLRVTEVIVL